MDVSSLCSSRLSLFYRSTKKKKKKKKGSAQLTYKGTFTEDLSPASRVERNKTQRPNSRISTVQYLVSSVPLSRYKEVSHHRGQRSQMSLPQCGRSELNQSRFVSPAQYSTVCDNVRRCVPVESRTHRARLNLIAAFLKNLPLPTLPFERSLVFSIPAVF